MSISKYPSKVNLPADNSVYPTVLDYLCAKFPAIAPSRWRKRMLQGKVHWACGTIIHHDTPYQGRQAVHYYREVIAEPVIPFTEEILFQDSHLLLAHKPHFLPTIPGGDYVNECLQNRLRQQTGLDDLQALHRLDRETAGLVLFSVNPESRAVYHDLFASRKIHKTYQAIANVAPHDKLVGKEWHIHNRLERGEPRFLTREAQGEPNAHSIIRALQQRGNQVLFHLTPITGRTHQLRVHMQGLGWPILHDTCYPTLTPKGEGAFNQPLQLLAKTLAFVDPITQHLRTFSSKHSLSLD